MFKNSIFLIVSLFMMSGCVTIYDPVVIPNYSDTLKVHPSAGTISTMTEMPASDHLVDNSQVFLFGNSKTVNIGSMLGGPLGLLIARSIDEKLTSPTMNNETETLSIKFHNIIALILSNQSGKKKNYSIVKQEDLADIIVLPYARLIIEDDLKATAVFKLAVRYVDKINDTIVTKNYLYVDEAMLNIKGKNGWAENNASILKEHSSVAFKYLIDILSNELSGKYLESSKINNNKAYLKFPKMENNIPIILVDEFNDKMLVKSIFNNKIVESTMIIYPKKLLKKLD